MNTWVLVIILVANSQPVGITSVPGYASAIACENAGRENLSAKYERYDIRYYCIHGPEK